MLYVDEKVLENLPTLQENVDVVKERDIRIRACRFVEQLGRRLGFPYNTVACAQYFLNYFYCFKSMRQYSYVVQMNFNLQDMGIVCAFVACKTEGTVKKIRSLLATAFLILNPSFKGGEGDVEMEIVEEHRKRIIHYETELLKIIKYDFCIEFAHTWMLKMAKTLELKEEAVLEAWDFIQICYLGTLCVRYPPVLLAAASLISDQVSLGKLNALSGCRFLESEISSKKFSALKGGS